MCSDNGIDYLHEKRGCRVSSMVGLDNYLLYRYVRLLIVYEILVKITLLSCSESDLE